jgi:porin
LAANSEQSAFSLQLAATPCRRKEVRRFRAAAGDDPRRCWEEVVGQSWNGWIAAVRFCAAGLWLLLAALPMCAAAGQFADGGETAESLSTDAEGVAADAQDPAPSWSGDLWTRSQLSGDWCGSRDDLAGHGVTFFGDITQYYQGVTTGGLERQFKYGGRGDYLIDLDSQKLGLWEGGHLDLRGETRLGQDVNQIDGAVSPSNFAMALPFPNRNVTALTGVQYTQDLSKNTSVFAGKLDILDGTPQSYAQGRRLNYFFNTAMQSNLSRIYLQPSVLGAGATIRDDVEPVFNFYLLDTHFTPTTSGFSTLFDNGVVAYGEYRLRTNWFELPGHSVVGLLYSNATRTALDSNPQLILQALVSGTPVPKKDSAWTVLYRFDQMVYVDAANRQRNWTLAGDYGLTDGNPNPIRWFANLSLVGVSPLHGRENDTLGIGYYHLAPSNLTILKRLGFGPEDGVELFYNIAVTPWFHVTPDLQIIDPSREQNATALLVGIRARLSF